MKLINLENLKTFISKIRNKFISKEIEVSSSLKVGEDTSSSETITLSFVQSSYTNDDTVNTYATLSNIRFNGDSIQIGTNGYIELKNLPENIKKTITINGYPKYFDSPSIDGTVIEPTDNKITYTTTNTTSKIAWVSGDLYIYTIVISYAGGYVTTLNSDGITTSKISINNTLEAKEATITSLTSISSNIEAETATTLTATTLNAGNNISADGVKTVTYDMATASEYFLDADGNGIEITDSDTSSGSNILKTTEAIKPYTDKTSVAGNITFSGGTHQYFQNASSQKALYAKNNAVITVPITGNANISIIFWYNAAATLSDGTEITAAGTYTITASSDITITCTGQNYITKIVIEYQGETYHALEVEGDNVGVQDLNLKGTVISDLKLKSDKSIYIGENVIPNFEKVSLTDFNALESKDTNTIYLVYEE